LQRTIDPQARHLFLQAILAQSPAQTGEVDAVKILILIES
jgi:hypothetical protein